MQTTNGHLNKQDSGTIGVVIGGDVCPIGKNLPLFKNGDAKKIFNDLLIEFKNADLSLINLECPLISSPDPIVKSGPVLGVESNCVNGIINAGIDVVNLANNHIMDHGPKGLENTIKVCEEGGISIVGAGKDLSSARKILIREINRVRFGILAVAENEFSTATNNSWGANPIDLIDYVRNVKTHESEFDYLIVLIHGGNEHYPFPSPRLQKTCRFMVEMGANAVIVQHTHCIGCYEKYQNAHIVYGQGNLIFDSLNATKEFCEGFLVKLSIMNDLSSEMHLIPYIQSYLGPGAKKMNKEEEATFRYDMEKRSLSITDGMFVQQKWVEFCEAKKDEYLGFLLGHNPLLRKLFSYPFFRNLLCSKKVLTTYIRNIILCESHRDILETIFDQRMI